ncbi:hypothetical protein [Thiomonas sp.]|uniref:Uncharacterized protein n=1 Tax=Thiomonas intermedia (strain K12) TaxID=75379 RepID=D5X5R6_THIK1|nr:hypothetical protein [Thiomonas sp.]
MRTTLSIIDDVLNAARQIRAWQHNGVPLLTDAVVEGREALVLLCGLGAVEVTP